MEDDMSDNAPQVKIVQTGPKTISLTFPSGTRAALRDEVPLDKLLALLAIQDGVTLASGAKLGAPVPV